MTPLQWSIFTDLVWINRHLVFVILPTICIRLVFKSIFYLFLRSCLELQGNQESLFVCKLCSKQFSSKRWLLSHEKKCGTNVNDLIDDLQKSREENNRNNVIIQEQKQLIKDLRNNIQELAMKAVSRSTTTKNTQINNYIQNLQPITDEHLLENVQHLSIDHILRGPEGYADYALEYPLKDRLICVDYARRKVKFKDREGNIITDPEMTNLATKFFNSIKDKNKELIVEYGEKLKENFGDEIDTIVKIFDYKSAVDSSSGGSKTEFQYDFVKQMCSKTIRDD